MIASMNRRGARLPGAGLERQPADHYLGASARAS
jgi:hypothetical protein